MPVCLNTLSIVLSFGALSLTLYAYMIPSVHGGITVSEAAAASQALLFMLLFSAIFLPVILAFTSCVY